MKSSQTCLREAVKRPELTKKISAKSRLFFLQPKAQFDYLVALKDSDDRAKAVIDAMESIEGDYETLRCVLPKRYLASWIMKFWDNYFGH